MVWSYSGARPLYDDGKGDPAAITRDYTLVLDDRANAVQLAIFGGKLTTYRKLAVKKGPNKAVVAVARELAGFVWAIGQTVPQA